MEPQKPTSGSDVIDLGQLFAKFGNGLTNLGMSILRLLADMRRIVIYNRALFISLILLAIVSGIVYARLIDRRYYMTKMILSSAYLNNRIVASAIGKLSSLAGEKNKKGLASTLNIPDSLAANIFDFSASPFVSEQDVTELEVLKEQLDNILHLGVVKPDKKNERLIAEITKRIKIENQHAFEITVWVYNPAIVTDLQNAIVRYFRDTDYMRKRMEVNKLNLLALKQRLLRDSQKLDSLKQGIYLNYKGTMDQGKQGSNNVVLGVSDPTTVYEQARFIYDEIQKVERDLYLQSDFELVDGLTQFSEPASAGLAKILAVSVLIAIGLAYLSVAGMRFNRYLANLE